jgi:glycosyltransferase involved in cell wall biosynthesis
LLDAVKDLKKKNIPFECHFVGAWSDITETLFKQKIEESGLSEVVFAHGPKYGADKYSYFQSADIFLFPTFYHYETFGIVNLEAMQHGLAIVSTPEGGIPDVVIDGETGFLVPQKNSKDLADKLELLIHQPELRTKMGMAGKKRFETNFTLDRFEKRFFDILKQAIG